VVKLPATGSGWRWPTCGKGGRRPCFGVLAGAFARRRATPTCRDFFPRQQLSLRALVDGDVRHHAVWRARPGRPVRICERRTVCARRHASGEVVRSVFELSAGTLPRRRSRWTASSSSRATPSWPFSDGVTRPRPTDEFYGDNRMKIPGGLQGTPVGEDWPRSDGRSAEVRRSAPQPTMSRSWSCASGRRGPDSGLKRSIAHHKQRRRRSRLSSSKLPTARSACLGSSIGRSKQSPPFHPALVPTPTPKRVLESVAVGRSSPFSSPSSNRFPGRAWAGPPRRRSPGNGNTAQVEPATTNSRFLAMADEATAMARRPRGRHE